MSLTSNSCRYGLCGLSVNGRYLVLELLIRVILGVALAFIQKQSPFVRAVYGIDWYNHYFPYQPVEEFPFKTCLIVWTSLMVGLPVLVYVTLTVWKRMPRRLVVEDALNFVLGMSLSILLTFVVTDSVKNLYGRPRPDFLSRCFGEASRNTWPPVEEIPAVPTCTNTELSVAALADGRRSFPSGHSSMAMCVFLYLGLFLYRKLSQIKNTGSLRLIIPVGLCMFAVVVMVSRTSDYRHFPTDVIFGGLIGTFLSLMTWLFYDGVMHHVYTHYCKSHNLSEESYVHDPLCLATPAQFVPKMSRPQPLAEMTAGPRRPSVVEEGRTSPDEAC